MYREHEFDAYGQPRARGSGSGGLNRRSFLVAGTAAAATVALYSTAFAQSAHAADEIQTKFRRISTPFIAHWPAGIADAGRGVSIPGGTQGASM